MTTVVERGVFLYEGHNKTALLSQQLIADTLVSLLRENDYASVSISRICKAAGVSRQTFYSVFGSKENVMLYELGRHCRFAPEPPQPISRKESLTRFSRSYAAYIVENRELIELLVRNQMIDCLYRMQRDCFMGCDGFMGDVTGAERQFLVDFMADSLSVIARNYIETGCSVSEETLGTLICRLLGGYYFNR